MFEKNSVILTGSTGLIGKEAIEPLEKSGFEVFCLSSKTCNLFDYKSVQNYFEEIRPEFLLHFAWITGGDYLSNPINNEYVSASMNMLKAFKDNGGKRVVMAGTCFEYDFKNEPIKESSPLNPQTLYAKCKVELCQKASEYCARNEISFAWGRIFYVFGHNEKEGRLTNSIINALSKNEEFTIKNGQLIRDYMYTKDIAKSFVELLKSDVKGPVNICTGKGISLGDYAMEIAKKLHKKNLLKIHNEETSQPLQIVGDNSILRSLLKHDYKFFNISDNIQL